MMFGTMAIGCGKGGGKIATDADSVAYVIGLNVGHNLLAMDSTLNVDIVCAAIRDVFDGEQKMSLEEGRNYLLAQKTYFVHEKAQAYQEQFLADLSKSDRSYGIHYFERSWRHDTRARHSACGISRFGGRFAGCGQGCGRWRQFRCMAAVQDGLRYGRQRGTRHCTRPDASL